MNKKPIQPDYSAELLKVLGTSSQKEGVEKAQALIGALKSEPLILTVSINRATGRYSLASNVMEGDQERDLRLLHEVIMALSQQLSNDRVQLAQAKP